MCACWYVYILPPPPGRKLFVNLGLSSTAVTPVANLDFLFSFVFINLHVNRRLLLSEWVVRCLLTLWSEASFVQLLSN